ncbi:MAG: DUF952 domain-containing protein [Chloroflexota bacterium]|nr:DUF952 domain-containing protein [Chloroflexota bacterium]
MATIYHIIPRGVWEAAQAAGDDYRGDTLEAEGFIHNSTRDQVLFVANGRFKGHPGLLLLEIDTDKLQAPLKYEAPFEGVPADFPVDPNFPHVYGALNLDAVVRVHPFEPNADGTFALPF